MKKWSFSDPLFDDFRLAGVELLSAEIGTYRKSPKITEKW